MRIKSFSLMSQSSLRYIIWYRAIPVLFFTSIIAMWIKIRGETLGQAVILFFLILAAFFFVIAIEALLASQREVIFNSEIEYKIFGKRKFITDFTDVSVSIYNFDRSIVIAPKASFLGIKSARFSFLSEDELNSLIKILKDNGITFYQKSKIDRFSKCFGIIALFLILYWGALIFTGASSKDVVQDFILFFYPSLTLSILASLRCLYCIDIK